MRGSLSFDNVDVSCNVRRGSRRFCLLLNAIAINIFQLRQPSPETDVGVLNANEKRPEG
jgi:hypothetical protein